MFRQNLYTNVHSSTIHNSQKNNSKDKKKKKEEEEEERDTMAKEFPPFEGSYSRCTTFLGLDQWKVLGMLPRVYTLTELNSFNNELHLSKKQNAIF